MRRSMASQSATALLGEEALEGGRLRIRVRLVCGCELSVEVAADRVLDTVDGLRLPVGKFPCPNGHPVRRPA